MAKPVIQSDFSLSLLLKPNCLLVDIFNVLLRPSSDPGAICSQPQDGCRGHEGRGQDSASGAKPGGLVSLTVCPRVDTLGE